MWNKVKIRGREAYSFDAKTQLFEYELGDVDRLNQSVALNLYSTFRGTGTVPLLQQELPHTHDTLPAGMYRVEEISGDLYFLPSVLTKREECLEFDIIKEMKKDFNHFMSSKESYTKLSLLHKRGILLYGPPGTGKTTVINNLINELLPDDTLVLWITGHITWEVAHHLKRDTRLKIVIFEELTEACSYNDKKQLLLDFLDGESSLDNCFIIGTTNYPERLPTNIVNRPGRFDKFYKVDHLSKADIRQYFEFFLKRQIDPDELTIFNKVTIAELKEMLLLIIRDGLTLRTAHVLIKEQQILVSKEFSSKGPVGFHDDNDDLNGIL